MLQLSLGGYPAKKCPRVTHNDNSPLSPPKPEVPPDLRRMFEDGAAFEDQVAGVLVSECAGSVFINERALGWTASIEATMQAIARGAEVIVNGRLPDVSGRVGAPDVLVRDGGGYLPVDIKNHQTFGSQKRAVLSYSSLASPSVMMLDPDRSGNGSHRSGDTLQLAHYTRMLQELECHAGGSVLGGIIGTSDFSDIVGARFGITWYDLDEPFETTYSASSPTHRQKRSAMERYVHEFDFRLDVAREARAGRELVRPIGTAECWTCVWHDYCSEIAGPADASFAFSAGRLDAREWLFLARHGGDTIEGLASLDAQALADEFVQHAVNKQKPVDRLAAAVERARMIRDDIDLEPVSDWPDIPTADIEIDIDIEWDTQQRIYQWGIRVREGQDETSADYRPAVSFQALDEMAEAECAAECADLLEEIVAGANGRTVRIFHWTPVEVSRSRKFPRVSVLLDTYGFDLCAWMKTHFKVRDTFSIKDIAPLFDFHWGVDDPGGFASMAMIETARAGDQLARGWCLEYNESDVVAQAAIRDGLRDRRAQASVLEVRASECR